MTEAKKIETQEELQDFIKDLLGSMTQANWLLLINAADLDRQALQDNLIMAVILWKKTGTNKSNWARILEMSDIAILEELGLDPEGEYPSAEDA